MAPARAEVRELQAELRRVQVLQPGEAVNDGVFDDATERAVRRLQWFACHVPGALDANGCFVPRPLTRLSVDGVVDRRTHRLIHMLRDARWTATGLLVRLDFERLPHTRRGVGFATLLAANPAGLCERAFVSVLARMDEAAQRFGVFVFVNELFRVEGSPGSRSIVPPSSFSSHKIGRAVDLQLGMHATPVPGHNPQDALQIRNAQPGTPFARFRQHAKNTLKCRYGGDFDPVDLPHFDRQVLPSGAQTWQMHYFFDQLQYRQALNNPAAIPAAAPPAAN